MHEEKIPSPHPDPWVDLLRPYITRAVRALADGGLQVERSWLDPRDPRDATILYTDPGDASGRIRALVWDEVTGWRRGRFEGGQQGTRTVLSEVTYLGGGVLLSDIALAGRVLAGTAKPRRPHRAVTELRDGLDDALRG